jgi:hypothetical protein
VESSAVETEGIKCDSVVTLKEGTRNYFLGVRLEIVGKGSTITYKKDMKLRSITVMCLHERTKFWEQRRRFFYFTTFFLFRPVTFRHELHRRNCWKQCRVVTRQIS